MSEQRPPGDEQWNLPPELAQELLAELADHAASAEEEGWNGAKGPADLDSADPEQLRQLLSAGYLQRELVEPHSMPQFRDFCFRPPVRFGLIGFLLALTGLGLALAADQLALGSGRMAAWLLQGLAWGCYACGVCLALQRAWLAGPGALLARLLQLGLITSCALLVAASCESSFGPPPGLDLAVLPGVPSVLDGRLAPLLGLVLTGVLLLAFRGRALAPALGLAICGCILYSGAPLPATKLRWTSAGPGDSIQVQLDLGTRPGQLVLGQRAGQLVSEQYFPDWAWGHRLGHSASSVEDLLHSSSPEQIAAPGMVEAAGRALLAPTPSPRLTLAVLALLIPCYALGGLWGLLGLWRGPEQLGDMLQAGLHACSCALAAAPWLLALNLTNFSLAPAAALSQALEQLRLALLWPGWQNLLLSPWCLLLPAGMLLPLLAGRSCAERRRLPFGGETRQR